MDASNIINIGILLVAAVASGIAAWQALDARAARKSAETASKEAGEHEVEALRASTASANAHAAAAAALQEANAISMSMAPKSPWVMTREGNHGNTIVVRNDSGRQLLDVDAHYFNNNGDIDSLTVLPYPTMQPNESLIFVYEKTLASPAVDSLILNWREAGDVDPRTWAFTLH
ncbi:MULTISPECIES: hypothetical protein [unclassified Leifsonia]|uniref:hypothetical protein n=1 Tax=unclassified Leifsonia TaxID=2663824 RepID=UPI0012F7AF27|nr:MULTISPECIES: hypothetical protein [unclassified Leifsonia]